MALVVSPQSNLHAADPTATLREALMSFESMLTDEQKLRYHASCAKPDSSGAITLIIEINTNNQTRAGRCVASRLYTFLEAIQQFTGVVGTFASSNPTIAALIWGGVKTTVLMASNIVSYFDKVTAMIMTIGKHCPTYQQFGQLYPGCVGLQHALCGYYAIIVRLCIKIIEISRRTAVAQTLSSIFNPFESEFKSVHDDLDQALKDVHLQISLASKQVAQETAKLLELESKDQAAHR